MWKKLVRNLRQYSSAVITGLDDLGYPFSVRCAPRIDPARKVLRLDIPTDASILPGPAGLLYHYHDEKLWHLRSFLAQGRLEKQSDGWIFEPSKFIAGEGLGGQLSLLAALIHARRRTRQYLKLRGLPRPKVPWKEINVLRAASRTKSSPNDKVKVRKAARDIPG